MALEFLPPGTYVRYIDWQTKELKYLRLLDVQAPLVYPRRMPNVAADAISTDTRFNELNPSDTKKHRIHAYLGVKFGFQYRIWHPYQVKILKWDDQIVAIDEDNTANITYDISPYEAPTFSIWIEPDRYPLLNAKNKLGVRATPEVVFIAALYVIQEHENISEEIKSKLGSGQIPAIPITFGGEI